MNKVCISKKILIIAVLIIFFGLNFIVIIYSLRIKKYTKSRAAELSSSNMIIGGENVKAGEYPYVVDVNGWCTGVLINSKWVLTAAHCLTDMSYERRPFVVVGKINKNDLHYYNGENAYEIVWYLQHPEFNESTSATNDIGLLLLDRDVVGVNTYPRLPSEKDFKIYEKGTEYVFVGWGNTGFSPIPSIQNIRDANLITKPVPVNDGLLHKIYLIITSIGREDLPKNITHFIYKNGQSKEHILSSGDSGAGGFYKNIVGFIHSGSQKTIIDKLPVGIADDLMVFPYTEWIKKTMNENSKRSTAQISSLPNFYTMEGKNIWQLCSEWKDMNTCNKYHIENKGICGYLIGCDICIPWNQERLNYTQTFVNCRDLRRKIESVRLIPTMR